MLYLEIEILANMINVMIMLFWKPDKTVLDMEILHHELKYIFHFICIYKSSKVKIPILKWKCFIQILAEV